LPGIVSSNAARVRIALPLLVPAVGADMSHDPQGLSQLEREDMPSWRSGR
jgi:hypothetical protein